MWRIVFLFIQIVSQVTAQFLMKRFWESWGTLKRVDRVKDVNEPIFYVQLEKRVRLRRPTRVSPHNLGYGTLKENGMEGFKRVARN